jgi:hypothetical protein
MKQPSRRGGSGVWTKRSIGEHGKRATDEGVTSAIKEAQKAAPSENEKPRGGTFRFLFNALTVLHFGPFRMAKRYLREGRRANAQEAFMSGLVVWIVTGALAYSHFGPKDDPNSFDQRAAKQIRGVREYLEEPLREANRKRREAAIKNAQEKIGGGFNSVLDTVYQYRNKTPPSPERQVAALPPSTEQQTIQDRAPLVDWNRLDLEAFWGWLRGPAKELQPIPDEVATPPALVSPPPVEQASVPQNNSRAYISSVAVTYNTATGKVFAKNSDSGDTQAVIDASYNQCREKSGISKEFCEFKLSIEQVPACIGIADFGIKKDFKILFLNEREIAMESRWEPANEQAKIETNWYQRQRPPIKVDFVCNDLPAP